MRRLRKKLGQRRRAWQLRRSGLIAPVRPGGRDSCESSGKLPGSKGLPIRGANLISSARPVRHSLHSGEGSRRFPRHLVPLPLAARKSPAGPAPSCSSHSRIPPARTPRSAHRIASPVETRPHSRSSLSMQAASAGYAGERRSCRVQPGQALHGRLVPAGYALRHTPGPIGARVGFYPGQTSPPGKQPPARRPASAPRFEKDATPNPRPSSGRLEPVCDPQSCSSKRCSMEQSVGPQIRPLILRSSRNLSPGVKSAA